MRNNYYDDAYIGLDGSVWAKGITYMILTNIQPYELGPSEYTKIDIGNVRLVEIIRVIHDTLWVGITTNGDLYSFRNGVTYSFGGQLLSVFTNVENRTLTSLLDNGRIRVLQVRECGEVISICENILDEEITDYIIKISPLNNTSHLYPPTRFLTISSDSKFNIVNIRCYNNDRGCELYVSEVFDSNRLELQYSDIKIIRYGTIITTDDRIIQVTDGNYCSYFAIRNCKVDGNIQDVMPITYTYIVLIVDGRITYSWNDNSISDIHPIEFLNTYIANRPNEVVIKDDRNLIFKIDTTSNKVTNLEVNVDQLVLRDSRTKSSRNLM